MPRGRWRRAIGQTQGSVPTTSTDPRATGGAGWTRFAPAPTGYLHLGQTEPYQDALDRLRDEGLAYPCDCTRATVATWAAEHGSPWRGPGCPGGCRERGLADDDKLTVRVSLGSGTESWTDRIRGAHTGDPSANGAVAVRDRQGNWTYAFAVVVDDLRQSVSLVVRSQDLMDATPGQMRMGQLLGRVEPPAFAHHPLIRKPNGAKLSKADHDTGVRDLRASGERPETVIGAAAAAVGLLAVPRPIPATAVVDLVGARLA